MASNLFLAIAVAQLLTLPILGSKAEYNGYRGNGGLTYPYQRGDSAGMPLHYNHSGPIASRSSLDEENIAGRYGADNNNAASNAVASNSNDLNRYSSDGNNVVSYGLPIPLVNNGASRIPADGNNVVGGSYQAGSNGAGNYFTGDNNDSGRVPVEDENAGGNFNPRGNSGAVGYLENNINEAGSYLGNNNNGVGLLPGNDKNALGNYVFSGNNDEGHIQSVDDSNYLQGDNNGQSRVPSDHKNIMGQFQPIINSGLVGEQSIPPGQILFNKGLPASFAVQRENSKGRTAQNFASAHPNPGPARASGKAYYSGVDGQVFIEIGQ